MNWGFLTVVAMVATTPLVAWQGVAHTTPFDALAALVVPLYWGSFLLRRERVSFPLGFWFWLIMLGSLGGLWAASARTRAFLTISQDIYLYLWFVTMVHLVVRHCRVASIIVIWVVVACAITLLSYIDRNTGMFGGHFAGTVRAAGTFLNPNMFGNYLLLSFFLAWTVAVRGRPLMFLALPILLIGLVDTGSNGAMAGFLGGCGAALVTRPTSRPLGWIGAGLMMAAVGVLALGVLQNDRAREQVMGLFHGGRSQIGGAAAGSAEERLPIWMDAALSIQEHPFGVGPDNFNKLGGPVSGTYYGPHNDYVGMMVERGPLGLLGWLGILGGTVALLPVLRNRSDLNVEAFYALIASQATHSLVIEAFHFRHVWFAFALAIAASAQTKAEAQQNSAMPFLEAA